MSRSHRPGVTEQDDRQRLNWRRAFRGGSVPAGGEDALRAAHRATQLEPTMAEASIANDCQRHFGRTSSTRFRSVERSVSRKSRCALSRLLSVRLNRRVGANRDIPTQERE